MLSTYTSVHVSGDAAPPTRLLTHDGSPVLSLALRHASDGRGEGLSAEVTIHVGRHDDPADYLRSWARELRDLADEYEAYHAPVEVTS